MTFEAAATVEALEHDRRALDQARDELTGRLPALRAERADAARAMILAGASRKNWQAALQSVTEGEALLADMQALGVTLDKELVQARFHLERAKHEASTAGLELRLHVVARENGFTIPEGAEFLSELRAAYAWLAKAGRTGDPDRKRSHTFWLDQIGRPVSTQAFIAAALCHGDIKIELSEHAPAFAITEYGGTPAASLPLTGDSTPSANRALITKPQSPHPWLR